MITHDGNIFGILALCVALVVSLSSSNHPALKKFFTIVPSVLLVYLIPALLTTAGIIDVSQSSLYQFNIDNLLPACLILMTLGLDLKSLARLGPKCLLVFFAGTLGVIIGGPIAVALVKAFAGDALPADSWKVFATLAGSWIGGGVNQAAMKEIFQVEETIFVTSVGIDVLVGGFLWFSTLLFLANKNERVNSFLRADNRLVEELHIGPVTSAPIGTSFTDYTLMVAVGFGGTALCRLLASPVVNAIKTHAPGLEAYNLTSLFFWIVIFASFIGIAVSLSPLRTLDQKGSSTIGSVLLYLLVASIGMKINLREIWSSPVFFLVGLIWILIHGVVIFLVARLLRAPLFFAAVGSQANIGAAASAPIVASAFSPHLAPIGVLLSILGYVLGNYGAYVCALLMRWVLRQ